MPFVYIQVPGTRHAEERNRLIERDLALALTTREAGDLVGSGGSLGETQPDGSRPVTFHRIDLDVHDLDQARTLLHEVLPAAGAPLGTELHHGTLHDVLGHDGWDVSLPAPGTLR